PALLADPERPVSEREISDFIERHSYWAADWREFEGTGAIADQVRFEHEWSALRAYAADRGVRLVGDLPIYVAQGSADHVTRPELFQREAVAGAPPDDWSETGQLWGNPLYDWHKLRETGYRWWIERFRRTFELFDIARVDHFRGFVSYWSVPGDAETALHGVWRRGPGRELFDAVAAELGPLPLIAEDLGVITPAVNRLRDELGIPGTLVLHFLLGDRHDPYATPAHRVMYTGTHDNDTSLGWWERTREEAHEWARRAGRAAGIEEADPAWLLIGIALAAPAELAIVPVQDLLGLGDEARMNTPGTAEGNWSFRLDEPLDDGLAVRLREASVAAGRTL
ncbi:MAG TPA: 4-alpha-glucanotransferase, partial [Gaiellaceae bacterium]|nr:4-alpha-glucanotransferase [Gaiellaceae bacterium]